MKDGGKHQAFHLACVCGDSFREYSEGKTHLPSISRKFPFRGNAHPRCHTHRSGDPVAGEVVCVCLPILEATSPKASLSSL